MSVCLRHRKRTNFNLHTCACVFLCSIIFIVIHLSIKKFHFPNSCCLFYIFTWSALNLEVVIKTGVAVVTLDEGVAGGRGRGVGGDGGGDYG